MCHVLLYRKWRLPAKQKNELEDESWIIYIKVFDYDHKDVDYDEDDDDDDDVDDEDDILLDLIRL